jgi:hypothetical protein
LVQVLADGRVRRTEAEWRGLIERFEKSGLSMTAFCRRAKLPRGSFVKWRRQLVARRSPAPAFVEWIAPPLAEPVRGEGQDAGRFELSLPGGVVLRWQA